MESDQELGPKRPVGIWIRVSTAHQAAGDSPEIHEARARAYALSKNWEVVELYLLAGVSGKSVRNHPECQRMMEDIRSGKIEALIFSKLARLARSTRELLEFAEYFGTHNKDLVSLQENMDTSTHSGRFLYTMLAGLAEFEREEIASRVRAGVATRAKLGKSLGGPPPYGFRYVDGKIELDPEEAPVRALMFELFDKHQRIKAIARHLEETGQRNRRGKPWSPSSIRHMLSDPIAKGLRRTNYNYRDPKTNRWLKKPESEWVWSQVPAIVSEELWERVNKTLQGRAEKHGRRPGRISKHLFTGLLFCACGQKMYVPGRSNAYRCKDCKTSIPTDDMEYIFLTKLREWLTPTAVAGLLLEVGEEGQAQLALEESLSAQIKAADAEMDKLVKLHALGELPSKGFRKHYEPIEERAEQLRVELKHIQEEGEAQAKSVLSHEQALKEAEALLESLESASLEIKRETVELLITRIEYREEEVVLTLNYLPFLLRPQTRVRALGGCAPESKAAPTIRQEPLAVLPVRSFPYPGNRERPSGLGGLGGLRPRIKSGSHHQAGATRCSSDSFAPLPEQP